MPNIHLQHRRTLVAVYYRSNRDISHIAICDIAGYVPYFFLNYGFQKPSPKKLRLVLQPDLSIPFTSTIDDAEVLSQTLIYDSRRNQQIVEDMAEMVDEGKSLLVLTERKAHIEVLRLYVKGRWETIAISGEDSKRSRESKLAQIKRGNFRIVLSTGQFFGEGIDVSGFDVLFLVYPFAFKGKLIQYIGRVMHSESHPIIYDYRDRKVEYFEKLFQKRNQYYKELRQMNQMRLDLD